MDSGSDVASGPAQTEVHVDRIIGAIHPFIALDQDPRMCAKCGLTRQGHSRSYTKGAGFDTPGPDPDSTIDCPDCGGTGSGNAWDANNSCPSCDGTGQLQTLEAQQNNNPATPPTPMLWRFVQPEDDSTQAVDPMLQGGNGTLVPNQTAPAGFHEPINPTGPPNATQKARAPRGSESGDVGEWRSSRAFNFVPQGQLFNPGGVGKQTQDAGLDLPRDAMGNIKQDGPVFGPSNPGMDPATQIPESSHMGSPDVQVKRPGTVFHHFHQCPQCGIATDPTEKTCSNPWCGHNLENDSSSSYDHWQETGGVSKSFHFVQLSLL